MASLFLMTIIQLSGQTSKDSVYCFNKIDHIEKLKCTKAIYQNGKLYVLNGVNNFLGGANELSSLNIYSSEGLLESSKVILTKEYNIIDFYKSDTTFFVCGRHFFNNSTEIHYEEQYKYTEGFVAEFSEDFKLLNMKTFPEIIFWKITMSNNSIYLLGELITKKIRITEKKFKSFIEIKGYKRVKNVGYENNESFEEGCDYEGREYVRYSQQYEYYKKGGKSDCNDVVLLKLNLNFKPKKFAHYAIDGFYQDGESLIVNSNGFVALSVNTVILLGADHHDGNLFLADSNLTMLWHKQYTDLFLGKCHVTPIYFNSANEIFARVNSYYCFDMTNPALLPNYNLKHKNKIVFDGLIKYNQDGKIIAKQESLPIFNNLLNPETTSYISFPTTENNIGYLKLSSITNNNTTCLTYYLIKPNCEVVAQRFLPKQIPPLLFRNDPYSLSWKIIAIDK
ncbi:MAG: hypothetical protein V4608_01175 [Bacteroidota bacterium]